ncbi:hypothetical protein SAMN05421771_3913 [Granulicella pectinivorans]|jgi:hypothetical protein|uniref:40-residue YVTN family beta-propeller repeat-containing protein n=1 Tax=Granulicella pectinivorans TaxID=474950 RepID=A0A1I6MYU2_9BACT|nr:hypothetical protein [Granulicella pectinivorans]SFS20870.1 hypothetical protein SAMN05421771_3913 [Granulicella pectinivorans]
MRRFVTLVVLLLFTVPFGLSISGCHKAAVVTFCGGGDSGVVVGQTTNITLQPKVYGISLAYAQKGQISTPAATDCKGNSTSPTKYTYGTTDMTIADVNPATGQLCAGTWNRNVGGGIADYTTCNPTNKTGIAYVTAAADSTTSNPLPVFVHPIVTSIVLGSPTPTASCATDPDPSTNCCAVAQNASTSANPYTGNSCLSQGVTGQLSARVYQNGTNLPADNISCSVGHLTYTPQDTTIVTIDQNGVATAVAPGSTIISASVSSTPSSAGFFSTCPPVSIALTNPGATSIGQNNTQPLTIVAKDTNNTTLTGLNLEYVSTTPATIPGGSSITPTYPGAASITAYCMPGTCNPSPFNQIGLFGNGLPVSSNKVQVTSPGTIGTILYIASTQSQYIVPVDFTTTTLGTPVRLPYVPTSMVISVDGSTIYLGSTTELMVYNAVSNAVTREDTSSPGLVLAVSPDGNTVVITDPVRKVTTLETSAGAVITTYGASSTHAAWTPDSQTVYITAGSQLLVYSTQSGWHAIAPTTPVLDVATTTPSVGAYFAGATTTARGYCPITTANGTTSTTNIFYPDAGVVGPITDRIAATNDGNHILGVTATTGTPQLTDFVVGIPFGSCPSTGLNFTTTATNQAFLTGVTATAITGVVPSTDSSVAFITYTGTGGVLPSYIPAAPGPGTVGSVKLSGTAIAPVAGVFSSDNTTFYVGTSGDNLVHIINRTTMTDTKTIAPNLPILNGTTPVAPNLMVQRPRKTTS